MREKALASIRYIRKRIAAKKRFPPFALLVLWLCLSFPANADNSGGLDPELLKALYTYKFGKFAKWPDTQLNSTTKRFRYCILGRNQFSRQTLTMLSGKLVQNIPLFIDVFDSGLVSEEALSSCHILFINKSEKRRLATILESIAEDPVLTVSDIDQFSIQGGMITLTEKDGKVRFQINPKALRQSKISLSSKIMKLAEIVNEREH